MILTIVGLSIWTYHLRKDNRLLSIEYQDSLYHYKNKLDQSYLAQDLIQIDLDSLRRMNNELGEEIRNLKENPFIITKVETIFQDADIEAITDSIRKDLEKSTVAYDWHVEKSPWYLLEGTSSFCLANDSASTFIKQVKMNSGIWLDVIENGPKFTVIARTENPYLDVASIQSAMIDVNQSSVIKKATRKKWSVGPYVGVGLGTSFDSMKFGFQVGIGIQYSIWSW